MNLIHGEVDDFNAGKGEPSYGSQWIYFAYFTRRINIEGEDRGLQETEFWNFFHFTGKGRNKGLRFKDDPLAVFFEAFLV